MVEWWTWPLVVGLILSAAGAWWAFLNRKGTERFETRTLRPPTWPEVWARMAEQDKRIAAQDVKIEEQSAKIATVTEGLVNQTSAIKRLLQSIAHQWPKGFPPPVLNPEDIDILGNTLPRHWLSPNHKPGDETDKSA